MYSLMYIIQAYRQKNSYHAAVGLKQKCLQYNMTYFVNLF